MPKYRLYIDESGTPDYPRGNMQWETCLGLTGVIILSEEYENVLTPRITTLKRILIDDLDALPVLHREEIIAKTGAFKRLADPEIEARFNGELIAIFKEVDYTVCCAVIDKQSHKNTYVSPAHPYHYCLEILLERYTDFLNKKGAVGDVMAESRGGTEDLKLKDEYARFYANGNEYRKKALVQAVLTSKEIKMKKKSEMITGLEFADILAVPTKIDVLATYGKAVIGENFNKQIIDAIQTKYFRGGLFGKIKGYGKKLL